jgi:hypothetical protein
MKDLEGRIIHEVIRAAAFEKRKLGNCSYELQHHL